MEKKSGITTQMCRAAVLFLLGALLFLGLHCRFHRPWMLSVYITLLTFFYHLAMRAAVGTLIPRIYKNREYNADSFGFRIRSFEPKLYGLLRVKKWKKKVITENPALFDIRKVGPAGLLRNVLEAELVHRVIMVLSFVPLLLIIPYGEPAVFFLTSLGACLADCVFVMIQRYNRPRILRMIKK